MPHGTCWFHKVPHLVRIVYMFCNASYGILLAWLWIMCCDLSHLRATPYVPCRSHVMLPSTHLQCMSEWGTHEKYPYSLPQHSHISIHRTYGYLNLLLHFLTSRAGRTGHKSYHLFFWSCSCHCCEAVKHIHHCSCLSLHPK